MNLKAHFQCCSMLLMACGSVLSSRALEGYVVIMGTNGSKPDGGVNIVDIADHSMKNIWKAPGGTSSAAQAFFSRDGKTIGFTWNGALYTMNNDGSNVRHHKNLPRWRGGNQGWAYTSNGIFWHDERKFVYRYIHEKDTVISYPLSRELPMLRYFASSDGRVGWAPGGDHSLEHPLVLFSQDFSSMTIKSFCYDRGHGNAVSGLGNYILHNGSGSTYYLKACPQHSHEGAIGHRSGDPVKMHLAEVFPVKTRPACCSTPHAILPGFSIKNHGGPGAFANSDEWLVLRDSKDNYAVGNWQTGEIIDIAEPSANHTRSYGNGWLGPLPSPKTGPRISINPAELFFEISKGKNPPAQQISVANIGIGKLGKVSISVNPPNPPWLAISQGGSGNAQTITHSIAVGKLTGDIVKAEITVSGGGSPNAEKYTIIVNRSSVPTAPSGLAAEIKGDSLRDVSLSWNDNSSNEDGFAIECSTSTTSWKELKRTKANATSFTRSSSDMGRQFYRICAFSGDGSVCAYSDIVEITVIGIPYICVLSPGEGERVPAGSRYTIRWKSNRIPEQRVFFSSNSGRSWNELTTQSLDAHISELEWNTPGQPIKKCIVKVSNYNGEISARSGAFELTGASHLSVAAFRFRPVAGPASGFTGNLPSHVQAMYVVAPDGRIVSYAKHSSPAAGAAHRRRHGAGIFLVRFNLINGTQLGEKDAIFK